MRKILLIFLIVLSACSTTNKQTEVIMDLPIKLVSESASLKDSPILASNIDDYLFREDSKYIDTREINQFIGEGHIAGFENIPFYEAIVSLKYTDNILYTMTKPKDADGNYSGNLGDVDSFIANYEESDAIMKALFPKNKNILIISTAGVESTYLINLLIQLGYDSSKLYNVGCFSNSLGNFEAYRLNKNAKHLVEGHNIYTLKYQVDFGELTKIEAK